MMNTFEKVIDIFKAVFEDEIKTDGITVASNLKDDIGINSIGMLYMAMAIEEEFGIKFQNEDLTKLTTVGDVIACIEAKA